MQKILIKMELNIINYLIDIISQLTSRHHISWNYMKFLLLVIDLIIYTYILKSFFPTSHISKFSLPFICYAGEGIHQKFRRARECAINFRTAKFWNRI